MSLFIKALIGLQILSIVVEIALIGKEKGGYMRTPLTALANLALSLLLIYGYIYWT